MRVKAVIKAALKPAMDGYERMRALMRRAELKRTVPKISQSKIENDLRAAGIGAGDVLFLHSSLKSLGYVEGGPSTVLNALLAVIGDTGTLIVPTYSQPGGSIYATCKIEGYVFDPAVHGTELGAIPSAFLKYPGVRRSLHPTHSVSAVGKHAEFITAAHHRAASIFGVDSPWERFVRLDGKLLGLGVDMGPITFFHMLEDALGDSFPLPVRMSESHDLSCRDSDGNIVTVKVVPLDPQFMSRRIDNPSRGDLREYFWKEYSAAGLVTSGPVGESMAWFVRGQAFYDHYQKMIDRGITVYSLPEDLRI